jgi:osmotically-inducible protein OsmY
MKTDMQLQKDVLAELKWTASLREAEIGVAAKDGVVTLSGYVQNHAQKLAAEEATKRVGGVRAVADDLKVKLPFSLERSDTEIAHAAIRALDWDTEVPDKSITVTVNDGWISLQGNVEWQFQKAAAERAVKYLNGARGVINSIMITPKTASPAKVSERIKDALKRSAEHDADQVKVSAVDGKVTLTGTVRSWAERSDAELAAWSAPGVREVVDKIMISAQL